MATSRRPIAKLPVYGVPVLVYQASARPTARSGPTQFVIVALALRPADARAAGRRLHPITTVAGLRARYLRTGDTRRCCRTRPVLITFDDGRDGGDAAGRPDPARHRHAGARVRDRQASRRRRASTTSAGARSRSYAAGGRWELENHTYGLHRSIDDVNGLPSPSRSSSASSRARRIAQYTAARRRRSRPRPVADLTHNGGRAVAFAYPFGDWGQHARTPGVGQALNRCSRAASSSRSTRTARRAGALRFPATTGCTSTGCRRRTGPGAQLIAAARAADEARPDRLRAARARRALHQHRARRGRGRLPVPADHGRTGHVRLGRPATSNRPQLRRRPLAVHAPGARRAPPLPRAGHLLRARRAADRRLRVLGRMVLSGNEIANGTGTGTSADHADDSRRALVDLTDGRRDRGGSAVPAVPHPAAVSGRTSAVCPRSRRARPGTALWSVDPSDFRATARRDREARARGGEARRDRDPPRRRRPSLGDRAGASAHPVRTSKQGLPLRDRLSAPRLAAG